MSMFCKNTGKPGECRRLNGVLSAVPPLDVESSLRSIRDIMTEFISKESVSVEQRIKKYTDEQYDMLNYWKDRAFKEHESLVR